MPATRQRKPRANPLIPVTESTNVPPFEQFGPAPICGTCFPAGWPKGGDYASCVHGDWSTTEGLVKRAAVELAALVDDGTGPYVIDGVTTDGVPVKVTIRSGEPALVSLAGLDANYKAFLTGNAPVVPAPPFGVEELSPFAPKVVEIDPAELDTGDDVMFMPSGG